MGPDLKREICPESTWQSLFQSFLCGQSRLLSVISIRLHSDGEPGGVPTVKAANEQAQSSVRSVALSLYSFSGWRRQSRDPDLAGPDL